MSDTQAAQFIGYTAGALITLCGVPQLITIIRNKTAQNVSLLTYTILLSGQILWICYGALKDDNQIKFGNMISSVLTALIITCALYYKRNSSQIAY
jgi:MtN3 and saliva related transmembrane protein